MTLRWVALALAVMLLPACLSDEMCSQEGNGLSDEQRTALVNERAQSPLAARPESRPLTLAELMDFVHVGSVDLNQVRAQVRQASAGVDEVRAELRPNLTIGAGVLGYAKPTGNSFFRNDKGVFDLSVDLSFPLDLSGKIAESVRAAQATYRSSEQRLVAAEREQEFLVAEAYFKAIEADEFVAVNAASIAALERSLIDARARLEVGIVKRNDVLVVEVALSNTRQRKLRFQTAKLEAIRALNAATGLPIDHPTSVAPWEGLIPLPEDVVPLLDRARHDNPDVDVLIETREALLHELESIQRSNWPDVSVGPRLAYTSQSLADPKATFVGFLSLNWNPDLNGRIEARAAGLEAQLVEAAWGITGLLRKLEDRILRSWYLAKERQSALRAATDSVGQARENLRIVQEQLRAGVATGREVLEAAALVAEQDGMLRSSRLQANLSAIELMYAAGRDPKSYVESLPGP